MIKSIKVRTSNPCNFVNIEGQQIVAEHINNKNETIALATTLFEDIILKDVFIGSGYTYKDAMPVAINYGIDLLLLDNVGKEDLFRALKDGDVAAKKRLLKQLEEL